MARKQGSPTKGSEALKGVLHLPHIILILSLQRNERDPKGGTEATQPNDQHPIDTGQTETNRNTDEPNHPHNNMMAIKIPTLSILAAAWIRCMETSSAYPILFEAIHNSHQVSM